MGSTAVKRGVLAVWFGLGAAAFSPRAAGQALGPEGSRIETNEYSVDLTRTPVLDSTRVTGLGGAFVAIAEGVDGNLQNPAAGAQRQRYSFTTDDYDWGVGAAFPTTITETDFFNTGRRTDLATANHDLLLFLTPALTLQFGDLALSGTVEYQSYGLTNPEGDRTQRITGDFVISHLQAAYGFLDGQFLLGGGVRISTFSLKEALAVQDLLLSAPAVGVELGTLVRPLGTDFRFGASFRSTLATLAKSSGGTRVQDDGSLFYTPSEVRLPWDVNVGFAYQVGERPLNRRWSDPEQRLLATRTEAKRRAENRARASRVGAGRQARATPRGTNRAIDDDYDAAIDEASVTAELRALEQENKARFLAEPRQYVLFSASLVITGPVEESVGVESFLTQIVHRSGQGTSYSPRLGVEAEPWANRLKFRVGSYLEPTRFATSSSRLHGTLGTDVKLFGWSVLGLFDDDTEWRISGAVDYSVRYFSWALSLGIWH
jgi:hypothetical protein